LQALPDFRPGRGLDGPLGRGLINKAEDAQGHAHLCDWIPEAKISLSRITHDRIVKRCGLALNFTIFARAAMGKGQATSMAASRPINRTCLRSGSLLQSNWAARASSLRGQQRLISSPPWSRERSPAKPGARARQS